MQAEIRLQQSRWDDEQALWNLWRICFLHIAAACQSVLLVIWRGEGLQLWWDRWSRTQGYICSLEIEQKFGIVTPLPIPPQLRGAVGETLTTWGGPGFCSGLQPVCKIPSRHCRNPGKKSSQCQINSFSSFLSISSWRKRKSKLARKK